MTSKVKPFQNMEPALDEVGRLLFQRFEEKGLRVKVLLIAYDDTGGFHATTNVTDAQAAILAIRYLTENPNVVLDHSRSSEGRVR